MKNFCFLLGVMLTLISSSCNSNDGIANEENIVAKESNRQYAPIGCVHFTNGVVDRWGVRCFSNRGNCKRATECIWLSDIFVNMLRTKHPELTDDNFEGYTFPDRDLQIDLYNYDPDLFYHPDSVK